MAGGAKGNQRAHDERETAGEAERENSNRDKPGGDLDDGIPF